MTYPYPTVESGVWEPIDRKLKIACCDCGLSHQIAFRVVKGKLWWCVHLDPKSTTRHRKAKNYLCKPKKSAK